MKIEDSLRDLLARGHSVVTAAQVAETMWPSARHHNASGQVFNLGAGAAGRMLRKSRAAFEVRPRLWQIVPEYLTDQGQVQPV